MPTGKISSRCVGEGADEREQSALRHTDKVSNFAKTSSALDRRGDIDQVGAVSFPPGSPTDVQTKATTRKFREQRSRQTTPEDAPFDVLLVFCFFFSCRVALSCLRLFPHLFFWLTTIYNLHQSRRSRPI
jgi:hypothetical protein